MEQSNCQACAEAPAILKSLFKIVQNCFDISLFFNNNRSFGMLYIKTSVFLFDASRRFLSIIRVFAGRCRLCLRHALCIK